ncbi:hypothetical protein Ec53638_A0393 (plasmid) [Escherichia coli 53638]|nr:hypothetical protein Ec53638_A0393 [Escherichia coli 53638]
MFVKYTYSIKIKHMLLTCNKVKIKYSDKISKRRLLNKRKSILNIIHI